MTIDTNIIGRSIMPRKASSNLAFLPLRVRPRTLTRLRGNRLFQAYLRSIPLLWVFGVLTPAGAFMLTKLAVERWPRGLLINLVVWSWFSIGLSQAAAAILNGIAIGDIAEGLATAAGFGVVGWIFGGLAIAAGAACHLNDVRSVRAISWVGGYIVILAAIAFLGRLAGRDELYIWPTPFGLLLPSSPSVTFYTAALVFQTEETLGEATTRLVLFFPWATALGLGGLAIAFISTLERNLWWRLIGFAGGVIGVVFSWSRIAIATLVVVGALLAFLRLPLLGRLTVIGVALAVLFALPLYGIDPLEQLSKVQDSVNGARAGSSLARELIYEKSWEGFLQSPIIGHGWIGESVHRKEILPIGSHSTIYGLLYTGGFPTLSAFLMAMLLTLAALIWRFMSVDADDPLRARILVGLGLALCLVTYCRYESLFNLTLPCLFLFTWIGACVGTRAAPKIAAPQGFEIAAPELAARDVGSMPRLLTMPNAASSLPVRALGRLPAAGRKSAFGNSQNQVEE